MLLKSENKYEDMIDIVDHVQRYIPSQQYTKEEQIPDTQETTSVKHVAFHPILFGGDQLTAKRARGSQKVRSNSSNEEDRLQGVVPTVEDWHTKACLLEVRYSSEYVCRH